MTARIPVYSDENNLHHIAVYVEEPDGTFVRTQSEPLRMLRDNIDGISTVQGNIVASKFDKLERTWSSPTVSFHYGRPQSIYGFMRDKIAENIFYVFAKPNMTGRIMRLTLHQLKLKRSVSQQQLKLFKEKYIEAIDLWSKEKYQYYINKSHTVESSHSGRKQRLIEKKKRAVQLLKEGGKASDAVQHKEQLFVPYIPDNISRDSGSSLELEPKSFDSVISARKAKKPEKSKEQTDSSWDKHNPFLID